MAVNSSWVANVGKAARLSPNQMPGSMHCAGSSAMYRSRKATMFLTHSSRTLSEGADSSNGCLRLGTMHIHLLSLPCHIQGSLSLLAFAMDGRAALNQQLEKLELPSTCNTRSTTS